MKLIQNKILVLIPSLYKGGAEKIGVTLFEEIKSRGFTVILVSLIKKDKYSYNFNHDIVYLKSKNIFLKLFEFIKIINNNKITTIYSASQKTNIFSGLACFFKTNINLVFREPNTSENFHYSYPSYLKKNILINLIRISYSRANHIIANSQDTKEDLINEKFTISSKIDIIENPIKLNSIESDISILDKSSLKVILIGRLEYQKNISLAVEICSRLNKSIPTLLTIVGSGSLKNQIHDLAKALNYNISIINSVDDVDKILKDHTFFLHTSRWEGYGNVLIESLRNALPIVSTCIKGGSKDILKKYSNSGLLITSQDPQEVSDFIYNNIELLTKSKKELKKTFSNEYNYDLIINKYLKYLK